MGADSRPLILAVGALGGITLTAVTLYSFPSISYFLRMSWIDVFTQQDPRLVCDSVQSLCEEGSIYVDYDNKVAPHQIDRSKHMNNALFLHELNFSRRHFFNSLGLWSILKRLKANMVVQCQTIRYRRELTVWQAYKIRTRVVEVSEDDESLFLESKFLTQDNFVAAIHHVKYKIVGPKCSKGGKRIRISPCKLFQEAGVLQHQNESAAVTPDPAGFIGLWEAANKISSRELNPKRS